VADAIGMAPRTRTSRAYAGEGRGRSALRAVLLAAIAGMAIVLGYKYALSPSVRPSDVRVDAPAMIDAEAARERAVAALGGKGLLFADMEAIERACEADPRVLSARARKSFPGGLSLELEPRSPVAVALCEEGGRTIPALVDAEGVVFMREAGAAANDLPVISGLRFEEAGEGSRLPQALAPLLRGLASASPGLVSALSEVRVVSRPTGEVELLLYMVDAEVPVRTDAALGDDDLKTAILVLDVLRRRGGPDGAAELDLRAGSSVYASKEDPS